MELRLRDAQVVEDGDPLVVARDLEELFPVDPVFRQLVLREVSMLNWVSFPSI